LYQVQGQYPQAAALYTKVLEVRRRVLGVEHPDTTSALASIGEVRLQQQRYTEAESFLRDALKASEKTTADGRGRYSWQSLLGASLAGQKKYAEAEPQLVSGYEGMVQRQGTISAADRSELEKAREGIVQLYLQWGKPEKAAEWQHKLETGKLGSAR
jgi:tetratricopeptide (TPR) repeat protein